MFCIISAHVYRITPGRGHPVHRVNSSVRPSYRARARLSTIVITMRRHLSTSGHRQDGDITTTPRRWEDHLAGTMSPLPWAVEGMMTSPCLRGIGVNMIRHDPLLVNSATLMLPGLQGKKQVYCQLQVTVDLLLRGHL